MQLLPAKEPESGRSQTSHPRRLLLHTPLLSTIICNFRKSGKALVDSPSPVNNMLARAVDIPASHLIHDGILTLIVILPLHNLEASPPPSDSKTNFKAYLCPYSISTFVRQEPGKASTIQSRARYTLNRRSATVLMAIGGVFSGGWVCKLRCRVYLYLYLIVLLECLLLLEKMLGCWDV